MARSRNGSCLLAWLALGAGCVYSFDNPVQKLVNGTMRGQVALQNAPGLTTQDAGVEVAWTGGLGVRLDATGIFYFIPLPGGTYVLNTYLPPAGPNDFPLLGHLSGIVLLANDALDLGTITLAPSALVSGRVTRDGVPAQAVVAAFEPPDSGIGLGNYEGYSVTTDGGYYAFFLPAGNHLLAASDSSLSLTSGALTLQAKATSTQNFALDGGSGAGTGSIEGVLLFGLDGGAWADTGTINTLLSGMRFVASDPQGNVVAQGNVFSTPNHTPGQGDLFVLLMLPAGQPLDLTFTLPDAINPQGTDRFDPLVLRAIPSVAGENTFLGQVTWLPVSTFIATAQANLPDAGSGSGGTTSGSTTGGSTTGTSTSTTSGSATTTGSGTTSGASGTGTTTGGGTTSSSSGTSGLAWVEVGAVTDPGAVSQTFAQDVVPLPLPGNQQAVVFGSGSTLIYATSNQSGAFPAPSVVFDAGGAVYTGTMVGASLHQGNANTVAWMASTANGVQLQAIGQADGGPWTEILAGSVPLPLNSTQAIALAYDQQTGVPWLAATTFNMTHLIVAPLDGSATSITIKGDAGGTFPALAVAATSCTISDGGSAICLAFTSGAGQTELWGAVFVPATQTTQTTLFTTQPAGSGFGGVAIADLGNGQLAIAANTQGATPKYAWATYASIDTAPTVHINNLTGVSSPPGLYSWQGVPLLVYVDKSGPPPYLERALALTGPAAPAFPSDAGAISHVPHGYSNAVGDVFVGLGSIPLGQVQLFELP